jgi:hypothetical protein
VPWRCFQDFMVCPKKNNFFSKINEDRVANNVFDLQNDFHEDRLSFPFGGEKINLGHYRPFFDARPY